jgi:hypothetical protein
MAAQSANPLPGTGGATRAALGAVAVLYGLALVLLLRRSTREHLGAGADDRVLALVHELESVKNPSGVRGAALVRELERRTGERLGPDPVAWRSWWNRTHARRY